MSIRASGTLDLALLRRAHPRRRAAARARLLRDRVGLAGALIVVLTSLAAVLAPWIAPFEPTTFQDAEPLTPPTGRHPLGTDEIGRDILSRLLYGARVSLLVSISSMVTSSIVGVAIGLVAGYYGRWLDSAAMGVMDVLFAFPGLLLALAIMAVLGPQIHNLVLALAIVSLPSFARIARASTLATKGLGYVESALALGARDGRIIARHILPNISAPLIVQFTIGLAFVILAEAGLSFIGLGIQPPAPSWGSMLARGKDYLEISPWPAVFPGLAIMVAVLGFNFLGDALRDALDPRLRGSM